MPRLSPFPPPALTLSLRFSLLLLLLFASLAAGARASGRSGGLLAIENVRLFDAVTARILPGQTVVVAGERIAAVGPAGEVVIPEGAERIDGKGKTLLPGLWDMHAHVSDEDGPLYLAAGVTGARDLGNRIDRTLTLRERWGEGRAPGPRLVLAGFLNGPGPRGSAIGQIVATPEEACAAVDLYADLGYRQLKLYNDLPTTLVPLLIDEARSRGLRVGGHIPNGLTTREAVAAGFDEIHHLRALFADFLPPPDEPLPPMAAFVERARQTAELDLGSDQFQAFLRLLSERKVVVDPTLSVFEDAFLGRPGRLTPGWARLTTRLPETMRAEVEEKFLPFSPEDDPLFRKAFEAYLALIRQLHAAGVTLVAGTDQPVAGLALHRELELYAEAGIPAPEVLKIATLGAARVAGMGEEAGSIEVGKLADLILVRGDPSRDLGALGHLELTIQGGTVYRPEELFESLGIRPDGEPEGSPPPAETGGSAGAITPWRNLIPGPRLL